MVMYISYLKIRARYKKLKLKKLEMEGRLTGILDHMTLFLDANMHINTLRPPECQ